MKKTFFICILTLSIFGCNFGNQLTSTELIKDGYDGVIFGNQNTKGISIYEFNNENLRDIIVGGPDVEYAYPVYIGDKFYCIRKIKENGIFFNDVIQSDLSGKFIKIKSTTSSNIYSIGLSCDGSKIAMLILSQNKKNIRIIDLTNNSIIVDYEVDDGYSDITKLVWDCSDNIFIIDKSISCNVFNLSQKTINKADRFPIYCNSNSCITAYDEGYLIGENNVKSKIITITNKTTHSPSLSNDGKFLIYGWLRGVGFETFSINEITSGRSLNIKLKHSGTALGLQLI